MVGMSEKNAKSAGIPGGKKGSANKFEIRKGPQKERKRGWKLETT